MRFIRSTSTAVSSTHLIEDKGKGTEKDEYNYHE